MKKTLTEAKIYGHLMEVLKSIYLASNEMIEVERKGNFRSELMEKLIPGSGSVFEQNVTLTNAIELALDEIELLKQVVQVVSAPINILVEMPEVLSFVAFLEMIPDALKTSMAFSYKKEQVCIDTDKWNLCSKIMYTKESSNVYEVIFPLDFEKDPTIRLNIITCYGSKKYELSALEENENNFNLLMEKDIVLRHAVKEVCLKFLDIIESCITKEDSNEIKEDEVE